tara:strand:- start:9619 stop:10572 length:954 start_codon:yes stop_codon:yes gene_type:complete
MRKDKEHIYFLNRERAKGFKKQGLPLDKNERVIPFSDYVLDGLRIHLGKNIWKYPDVDSYYEIFSNWLNVNEKNIFFTEGVSGAIRNIMELYVQKNVYYDTPTYAMYDIYRQIYNLKLSSKENSDVIFLQNPNIPYGTTYTEKEIRKICSETNSIVALDDVYFGFNMPDYISLINEYENLIIMRSFSKAFGLASIRLGYVISNEKHINFLSNNRNGYETNLLSLQTAHYFIENEHFKNEYVNQVNDGRNYLIDELKKLSIRYEGGHFGNFIFIHIDDEVFSYFADRGILVRKCDNGIRVTLGPKKEMEKFIVVLKEI